MVLTDDLVAYYKLDDKSGDALDSVGSFDGTFNGDLPTVRDGVVYKAQSFNGTSDEIRLSTLQAEMSGATAVSVSLWFKPSSLSGINTLIVDNYSSTGNPNIAIRTNGTDMQVNTFGINGVSWKTVGVTLATGNWYHVVVTIDQSNTLVYLNGTLKKTETAGSGSSQTGDYGYLIGNRRRNLGSYNEWFEGLIDETSVYKRVLDSTEVTLLYRGGQGNTYPFTFTSSTVVGDTGGYGTKAVYSDYPVEEGLIIGTTKRSTESASLSPEEASKLRKDFKEGI